MLVLDLRNKVCGLSYYPYVVIMRLGETSSAGNTKHQLGKELCHISQPMALLFAYPVDNLVPGLQANFQIHFPDDSLPSRHRLAHQLRLYRVLVCQPNILIKEQMSSFHHLP